MKSSKHLIIAALSCGLAACGMNDDSQALHPSATRENAKPGMFDVFFDVDRSELSDTAHQILQLAAASALKGGTHRVTISIHPVAAGWSLHSQALAETRAEAVKAALVSEGVPAAAIDWVPVAKNPVSSTNDEVRDPENRRTEIIVR